MSDELVVVRFIKKQTPYQAGELAGFVLASAKRLVDGGVGVYHNPPPGLDEFGRPLESDEELEPKKKSGRKAAKEDSVSNEKEKAELDKRKTGDPGTVKK